MAESTSTHNIVILGASFAGLGVAHGLLKAIPALHSQTMKTFKVSIITNIWIQNSARFPIRHTEMEEVAQVSSKLHFDTLVIATGSKGPNPLYSLHGSHTPTLKAYKDVHTRLPSAQTVLVVGGGSAGTETAGELGHLHGERTADPKDITILSGTERLLPALRPAIGKRAEEMLMEMGVKTQHNVGLMNTKKLVEGGEEVTLSDGSKRTVDLLLVTTGRYPATSFLPSSLVDDKQRVIVDAYMRIPSVTGAYAVGDLASNSPGGVLTVMSQAPATFGNIIAELSGKGLGKEWKPVTEKEMQIVPVGPQGGVGAVFGWWLPSFGVKMIKSKDFMFPKALKTVMGTA